MDTDHKNLLKKLEAQSKETGDALAGYSRMNIKFDKTMARLEPLHERMEVLEDFTQKSVPLLTHLQISDALQEFLCIKDQLKLIEYDNLKLKELRESLIRDEDLISSSSEGSSSESEESTKLLRMKGMIDFNKLLHARMQVNMTLM